MPLLPVNHRLQESRVNCLSACVQTALDHLAIQKTQTELNQLLGLTSIGIPFSQIKRVETLGCTVVIATGEEVAIQNEIDNGFPVIIPVDTGQLQSYWTVAVQHSVLAIGYDTDTLYLNDPDSPDAPKQVNWIEFMLACEQFDFMYAVIKTEN